MLAYYNNKKSNNFTNNFTKLFKNNMIEVKKLHTKSTYWCFPFYYSADSSVSGAS